MTIREAVYKHHGTSYSALDENQAGKSSLGEVNISSNNAIYKRGICTIIINM